MYGNDISSKIIYPLRKKHPDWKLGVCDFLNSGSRNTSFIFNKKYDVILLNPPFTCRGSIKQSIKIEDKEYRMSTAMAYIVEAIKYLQKDGVLYAILPISIAYSQKDEKIRAYLTKKYYFQIIEELDNQWFEKCKPNIVLAAINDKNIISQKNIIKRIDIKIPYLIFQRGSFGMHMVDKKIKRGISLVHSTNIIDEQIVGLKYKVKKNISMIKGPAVLIHRVGQPNKKKVCVIWDSEVYAISDCIIGIKANKLALCWKIKKEIINNWSDFSNLYKGTGAKYITIKRLKYFFNCDEEKTIAK